MARYEAVKAQIDGCGNACNAAYFSDKKTGKDLSPAEVCDLLNAHYGMMTREQVEKEIEFLENSNHPTDNGAVSGFKTVLNGGTK